MIKHYLYFIVQEVGASLRRESDYEHRPSPTQFLVSTPSTSAARQPHAKRHSRTTYDDLIEPTSLVPVREESDYAKPHEDRPSPNEIPTPAPSTSTAQQPHDDPLEAASWVPVLLLEVSKRITEELELYALGAMLGVQDYTIKSLLRDYRGINEASFQVLLHWRQKEIDKKREWPVLKKQLENALRSKHVGMLV